MAGVTMVQRHPYPFFLAGIALLLLGSWQALHSGAFARHPDAVAAAVAFDLTATATLLGWFTLVRTGASGAVTLAAVFAAGAAMASRLLASGSRPWLVALVGLGEAVFLGSLAWRAARLTRAWRAKGRGLPPEDALREVAREALGPSRVVEALATEAAILWLALASWGRAPDVPAGWRAFTLHRRSGLGAVAFAIALAGVGEIIGTHLLVAQWSARWAWVATAAGLYGLVWLAGDFRAVVLRPVLLSADALVIRVGLRWRVSVPLAAVRAVCLGTDARGHPGALRLSPIGPPALYVHLSAPVEVAGLFGLRRRTDLLGLRVDDPEGLAEALRAVIATSAR
jgi:hypothetical protein